MTKPKQAKSRSSAAKVARIAVPAILVVGGLLMFQYRSSISTRIDKVFAAGKEDPVPVTRLTRQPFRLTVSSTGEIVGMETTSVATPNTPSGSLKLSWLVPEGRFVSKGETIIRFDSTDARLSLESQQNTLQQNQEQTKITTLQQSTDDKVLTMDRNGAQMDYDYAMTVMPQDETIYSKWDIITAEADAHYAKERIEFLKNKAKTQQRIARSDTQILAIKRNRAQSEVSVIKETLNSLEVQAPADGLVLYRRDRREEPAIGDECHPGQVLLELVNLDVLQARIYVLERDGGALTKGQKVSIKMDAIPEKEYHGTIRSVSSVAGSLERNSPLRYFTCDVAVSDAGQDLKLIRPGMNLRGDVVLESYDSCFVVPSSAVTYREKERDSQVYVQEKGKFVPRTVQTGLSSHGEAVILSGIQDGTVIALRNPVESRKSYIPEIKKGGQNEGMMGMPPPGGGRMMMFRGR